ncbi:unnamed protein product [Bursaphelenchus xylophilus]|uniref:(pine wood nematode) hypothetical protein n=1 Tax=Bursaphelenchus xylophilus TaxID=6326 RepID=A0A7I8WLJ6_BURXY|nr:unnamed protein product [Bursaphelenchus xylophilus]CAG9105304.1 unnamed protein product [Bursaphelenchus xylophilus]
MALGPARAGRNVGPSVRFQIGRAGRTISGPSAGLEVAIGLGRPGPARPGRARRLGRAGPGLSKFEKALGRPDRFGPRAGPTLSARPGPEGR